MGHVGENLRCQSIDRATDEQRMKEHVHRGVKAEPQAGIGIGCGGAVFTVLILITLKVFSHSYRWRGQLALHTVPSSADHIPDTCKLSAITPWAVPFSTELQKKFQEWYEVFVQCSHSCWILVLCKISQVCSGLPASWLVYPLSKISRSAIGSLNAHLFSYWSAACRQSFIYCTEFTTLSCLLKTRKSSSVLEINVPLLRDPTTLTFFFNIWNAFRTPLTSAPSTYNRGS